MSGTFSYLSILGTGSAPPGGGGLLYAHVLNTENPFPGGSVTGGGTTNYYSTVLSGGTTSYVTNVTSNVSQYSGPVISAGANSQGSGTVVFSNSNGVTFGLVGGTLTASVSAGGTGGADGGNVIAAGGSTAASTGTIVFSNANGVSFGLNGNTVTGSHNGYTGATTQFLTTAQPVGAYLTTAAQSGHTHGSAPSITGSIGVTSASNAWSISIPAFLTTAQPVGAYLTTAAQSDHTHSQYQSTGAYLTTAQPVGAYLTTARASNDAIGLNSALTANGVSVTANSSGLSLNFPAFLTTAQPVGAYLTTAANSTHSHGNPTLALTNLSGTTASASNGFTLSLSAAAPGGGGGAGTGFTGTNATGTLNSNGLAISVAAPGAGPSIANYCANPPWQGGGGGNLITNLTATAMTQRPFFMPFEVDGNLTAGEIHWGMSRATSGSNSFTVNIGIYSFSNSSKLNLIGSVQNVYVQTDTASISGLRGFEASLGTDMSTLSNGQYVLAMAFSATATVAMNYSLLGGSTSNSLNQTAVIYVSNAYHTYTSHHAMPFYGRYTTTSGVIPATVGLAEVIAYQASQVPLFFTLANHV